MESSTRRRGGDLHFKGYTGGYDGLIPPYIVLTKPQGRFSEPGFLGASCKPFATGGDPALTPFAVEGWLQKESPRSGSTAAPIAA